MNENQLTGGSGAQADEQLRWFYGLAAIAHYMNWGELKVLRMNQKYHFPLLRLPTEDSRHWRWQYATNTLLIGIWLHSMAQDAYRHVAQTALGRRLRRTRGPVPAPASTQPAPAQATPMPQDGHEPCMDVAQGGWVKPPRGQGD